uniref:Bm14 n=1 Tax=Brugia malayi TaxID=6279 RepID=A0A1I9GEW4_BRUMA|nr:Bm14 [Brugia malayi]
MTFTRASSFKGNNCNSRLKEFPSPTIVLTNTEMSKQV